jgi:heme A synthase
MSTAIPIFFMMVGLWGLWRAIRKQGVDGSYIAALVIAEGLYILQAILGGLMYFGGARPDRGGFHVLYGVFAIVFLPGLFAYLRGDDSNRAQWVYALGTLFLFGIALRAISTG